MCGIGGILRIVKPGDADYPADPKDPLRSPSGAWHWHGLDVRDLTYARADADASSARGTHDAVRPSFLIPESWLDAIDDGIKWRGPDGAGRFRDRVIRPDGAIVEVALVHRRLAIIDLQGGAQPMVVQRCPRCAEKAGKALGTGHSALVPGAKCLVPSLSAIVFNGCIYNHRELRAELEAKGHVFESDHSDTEVILHAVSEWASEAHWRFDGMYSCGVWDRVSADVEIMRDTYGEKPFRLITLMPHVDLPNRGFGFASSTAALSRLQVLAAPRCMDALDPDAILTAMYSAADALDAVPSVEYKDLGTGQQARLHASSDNWWDADPRRWHGFAGMGEDISKRVDARDPSIEEIGAALVRAVRGRLESDVPIGCLLSGGVDSSLVAWAMRCAGAAATAVTVRMPDEGLDESRHAAMVAAHLGIRHEVVECQTTAANDLVRLIEALGEPFADSSLLPTFWVCQAARAHVKAALSGDGADEHFFGYDRFRALAPLRRWRWLLKRLPLPLPGRLNPQSFGDRLARLADAAISDGWTAITRVFPQRDAEMLFPGSAPARLSGPDPSWSGNDLVQIEFARRVTVTRYLRRDILRKVDTASMLAGIEVRAPFLAPCIADLALSIPASLHMKGGETKHLLKELARKHLPREIVDRPKQGFAIPISNWWRTNFGGLQELLLDSLAGDKPFGQIHDVLDINMDFVRRMLDEHWAAGGLKPLHTTRHVRPRDHGQRLFALVSLAIWARAQAALR